MKGGEIIMKKIIATAVTIGAVISSVGLGSAFAQTATPTTTPTTTTVTPTPSSSVTVPSGAPATGNATN